MNHPSIEEAEAMPESELHTLVSGIVDRKLEVFKTDLQLELMPIKIALESHERQMAEIRGGTLAMAGSLARMEGRAEATSNEQRRQHQENTQKLDQLFERVDSHIGEHAGQDKHQSETEKQLDRMSDKRRAWAKVGIGVVSSGGVIKWLHDHWNHWHLK